MSKGIIITIMGLEEETQDKILSILNGITKNIPIPELGEKKKRGGQPGPRGPRGPYKRKEKIEITVPGVEKPPFVSKAGFKELHEWNISLIHKNGKDKKQISVMAKTEEDAISSVEDVMGSGVYNQYEVESIKAA